MSLLMLKSQINEEEWRGFAYKGLPSDECSESLEVENQPFANIPVDGFKQE